MSSGCHGCEVANPPHAREIWSDSRMKMAVGGGGMLGGLPPLPVADATVLEPFALWEQSDLIRAPAPTGSGLSSGPTPELHFAASSDSEKTTAYPSDMFSSEVNQVRHNPPFSPLLHTRVQMSSFSYFYFIISECNSSQMWKNLRVCLFVLLLVINCECIVFHWWAHLSSQVISENTHAPFNEQGCVRLIDAAQNPHTHTHTLTAEQEEAAPPPCRR